MSSKTKTTATKDDGNPTLVPKLRFPEFSGQPVREVRLKEVTAESTVRNGKTLATASVMGVTKAAGIVPMEDRLIASDIARYKLVRKDWFAYNPMRLNIGSIARWQGERDILVSPDYVVFKCVEEGSSRIDPVYLDNFRRSDDWGNFVSEKGDGSVRIRIYYKDLARLQLALPPFEEQQKIAECLSSVDELIAAQARKVDELKTHKKGLMQQLFPRKGETQPRLRFPEFQNTGEWEIRFVSQLARVTTGAKDTQNKIEGGRYPFFVRSQTVERIDSYSFDGEAVLTSGDGVGVGKNFHYIKGKFDFHQRVYCIYDFECGVSGLFFYLYFSEHFGDRVMRMSAKNSVDSVRMAMITEMPVAMPSLSEQQRIADCLTCLDELITAQTQKHEALKTHKKGLMQQLFPTTEVVEA